ncbi:hypothetical protein SME36J_51190 (plasmid) [Serratia marcescens]|nr:hypothetical protein SME36J_51190 [Serratia marcescens]
MAKRKNNPTDVYSQEYVSALLAELEASKKSNAFLKEQLAKLANFNPDWDMVEACRDSWREVAAALNEAEAKLKVKDKRIADDEEYIEKLESAWGRINELEINEKQMLRDHYCAEDVLARQRNDYESALEGMYEAVTGKRPAWGCGFGADEAVKEVGQIHAELEKRLATPVRLPERYSVDCGVCADPNGEWLSHNDVIATLFTAGLTVQGDE